MKNCLIIAGEKSGEDHVMSFLPELKKLCPDVSFWGVGGDEMSACSFEQLYHLKEFSSWGFSEVIGKIPFYKKALKTIEEEAVKRNCDAAILVDFQDFNMRLAKRLKSHGIKVLYYVAPQAWAWKSGRVKALIKNVETLFTIIPFEKKWFKDRGVKQVVSVSHPLWLQYQNESQNQELTLEYKSFEWLKENPNLLLLPGSRNFEVKSLLPKFMRAIKALPFAVNVGIVRSSTIKEGLFTPYMDDIDRDFTDDQLVESFNWAGVTLAASGTVTLACALFQVPTVMTYHTSLLNEYIFKTFLSYDGFIGLANIVHEEEVFPELIQNAASSYNMQKELEKLFMNEDHYKTIKTKLARTNDLIKGELENPSVEMAKHFKEVSNNDN